MVLKPLVLRGVEFENPFGAPSGTITTNPDVMVKFAEESAFGFVVTKSYGAEPREGNKPPILVQQRDDPRSFRNSVGLRNPGAEEGARQLREIYPLPKGKKLITSVFSDTPEGFAYVARKLAPYADAIELNVSCRHSSGIVNGTDPKIVEDITRAVRQVTDKPVIVKLTPMAERIGEIAKAAERGGADAISAINTHLPEVERDPYTGKAILTSSLGGSLSGSVVKKRALECAGEITHAVDIPLIVMGGIRGARDIDDFLREGNGKVGGFEIGSALFGLDTETCLKYTWQLLKDRQNGTNLAEGMAIGEYIMLYRPYRIRSIEQPADDLRVFRFEDGIESEPGQFVFAWVPEVGERPFSVAYNRPLTLAFKKRGVTTSAMFDLKEGDELMVRGPYGKGMDLERDYVLVLRGTGAATGYAIAKALRERGRRPVIMEGARTAQELLFAEEFAEIGRFIPATEDGSAGIGGFVTNALEGYLENSGRGSSFFNCGPEGMMATAMGIEEEYRNSEDIFYSSEDYMGCGVGACGACSRHGYRSCVDGPIFRLDFAPL